MDATTVIRGGTVVDGTGNPGRRADVAVRAGRVVEVGEGLGGDHEIDASGHVVAPGFIDIHTHYDAQVFWDPALTPSCFHGVTTVVAGNCGFSLAPTRPEDRQLIADTLQKVEDMDPASLMAGIPWDFESFPEYLQAVERRGSVLNYAAYLGHTPLRLYVMGAAASERAADAGEVARMADLVREAMDAGAAGFATSFAITHLGADGRPIPSRLADKEELRTLFRAVGDSGRGVLGINGGEGLTLREVYAMQPSFGAPVTYTAFLTQPNGSHFKAVDIHRAGTADGAEVWPQVSCRPLSFSMLMTEPFTLNTNPVFAELMPRSLDERRRAYGDPAWRQRVRDAWEAKQGIVPQWDTFDVLVAEHRPDLVGRSIPDLAADSGGDCLDALLDAALAEPDLRLRVRAVLANGDEDGIAFLLQEPGCTLGLSDAGAHVGQLCDAPLATDLLGNWVRERGVLSLEAAVNKLTKVQADLFGFADRGVLRSGAFADIVVFDPDTVDPGPVRRVADFPAGAERLTADQPSGMRHLLVNGEPVIIDGKLDNEAADRRPGQVVRPAPRR